MNERMDEFSNEYWKILSKLPYVMISQTAGQSNTEMETGSETVGVRACKKYRKRGGGAGGETEKE